MNGLSGFVKIIVAMVIIFAAATGTEVVDVVELTDEAVIKAQSYFNTVDVDGDETDLFDDSVEREEFARASDKVPSGIAFTDESTFDATAATGTEDDES